MKDKDKLSKIDLTTAFVDHAQLEKKAVAGDLIEFYRGSYRHWAMYAGSGKVVNICAEDKSETKAWIKLQTLKSVCQNNPNKIYQNVRINNQEKFAKNEFNLKPKQNKDALEAAMKMVDKQVKYNFVGENCEYYSTLWKYGKGWSEQVFNHTST